MIFYFSGSGNSEYVANTISEALGDKCVFIPDVLDSDGTYELSDGERLGFVFPVYAWGIPDFVAEFMSRLYIKGADYVYYVCTCGDDTGKTKEQVCNIAKSRGWNISLGYAVQMPNTYVCLPGFDVDDEDLEKRKLANAKLKLEEIILHLRNYDKDCFETLPGDFAWLKSAVIRPLFNKCLITAKPFHTDGKCIHCGKCVKECPMENIKLSEETSTPQWGDKCVGCLRCYHLCPAQTIQYGTFTKGKGQYCYKKQ